MLHSIQLKKLVRVRHRLTARSWKANSSRFDIHLAAATNKFAMIYTPGHGKRNKDQSIAPFRTNVYTTAAQKRFTTTRSKKKMRNSDRKQNRTHDLTAIMWRMHYSNCVIKNIYHYKYRCECEVNKNITQLTATHTIFRHRRHNRMTLSRTFSLRTRWDVGCRPYATNQ